MKNKKIRRLLAVLLIGIMLISSMSALAEENNETAVSGGRDVLTETTSPLIEMTYADLKVYDTQGGTQITDLNNIPKNAYLNISYAFNILDLFDELGDEVKEGDYFSIPFPTELINIAEFEEITDKVLQVSGNGETKDIAKLNVTQTNGIVISFLKDVEGFSDVTVNFSLGGFLQPGKINDGDIASFSLIASGTVYTVGFIPDKPVVPEVEASIEKSGEYNKETNETTWKITVDSGDSSLTVTDVIVKDILGTNQTFVTGSTQPIEYEPVLNSIDNTCLFDLSDVTGATSFTYKTTPTNSAFSTVEGNTTTVDNLAELYYEGEADRKDFAEAGINITTDWIKKSGTARTENGNTYIDWTIDLNNNYRTIPKDTIISDTLPTYLILDASSVKRNGSLPADLGDSVNSSSGSLSYEFGADTTGKQTITFTTQVDGAYYQQQAVKSFTNSAIITVDGVAYKDKSQGVGVSTNLLNKYGDSYNASTGSITWRLNVNENGQDFSDAIITDSIGTGLQFDETYGILNDSGVLFERVDTLDKLKSKENQFYYQYGELQIYLGDLDATDKPILYFQTTVTDPNVFANNITTSYSNSAILTGTGITDSDSTGSQTVKSQVISKENTGYDYLTRLLSWKITVNQNNMTLPDAIITDTIGDGQTFVLDSIKVDGVKLSESQFTVNNNQVIINLGQITSTAVITFQTEVTDLDVFLDTNGNVTFDNTAKLNSGITGAPTVSVSANKVVNNKALSKGILTEYVKENGYIEWEVYANSNQAPLKGAVLNDVLQEGLELDAESVALYKWNQDATGNMSIGELVSYDKYTFTYDYDTRNFLLNLPDGNQGYYLKFKTDVLKPGKYSNSISFGGAYTGTDSDASSYYVTNSDLSAGVSGVNGSVKVHKTNDEGQTITTGAEFELLDSKHNVIKTLTTDENGDLTFDKLKLRTYYVREKTAPLGYEKSDQEYIVTLSATSAETRNQTLTIANSLLTGNIFLKKVNEDGEGLAGGTFSIYEASDVLFETPLDTVMSKEEGVISFQGLKEGSYVIKEVKAPAGYNLTTQERNAKLVLDTINNVIPDVTVGEAFINEAIPSVKFGSAELFKSDEENKALQGAEFGLYDEKEALLQTAISKEDGTVLFTNIPYGTYSVREITAPQGYELTSQVIGVTIKDSLQPTKTSPYAIVNKAVAKSETDDTDNDSDSDSDSDSDNDTDNDTDSDTNNGKKGANIESGGKIVKAQNNDNNLNTSDGASANTTNSVQTVKRLIQAGSFWDEVTLVAVAGVFIFTGIFIRYKKRKKA